MNMKTMCFSETLHFVSCVAVQSESLWLLILQFSSTVAVVKMSLNTTVPGMKEISVWHLKKKKSNFISKMCYFCFKLTSAPAEVGGNITNIDIYLAEFTYIIVIIVLTLTYNVFWGLGKELFCCVFMVCYLLYTDYVSWWHLLSKLYMNVYNFERERFQRI